MNSKKTIAMILAAMIAAAMFTACSAADAVSGTQSEEPSASVSEKLAHGNDLSSLSEKATDDNSLTDGVAEESSGSVIDLANTEFFTERDLSGDYDESKAVKITCFDSTFKAEGEGVVVKDNVLTITTEGVYILSGTIKDGRIVVEAGDSDKVQLVLNGYSITSSSYSAIYVKSADKVFITTAKGTKNTVADGKTYASDSEESNVDAAIFSKSDLVINGGGELTVTGSMSHAIVSKDDLKITGGTLGVTSVDSAIAGKDSVRIANAAISITSGGDGIKSSNTEDVLKGYVYLESGTVTITSGGDAIQADTSLINTGAKVTAQAGGGSSASTKEHTEEFGGRGMFGGMFGGNEGTAASDSADDDSTSTKGLKAGGDIIVKGGEFTADSADDAVHSDGSVTIEGGKLTLTSGDDGIHAEENVVISGGELTITGSYEGIEGKSITIKDGTVDVTSSDDGMNATDGVSEGGMPGAGGGMMGGDAASSDVFLLISGGTVHVNADGDGLDSNGTLKVEGGNITVDGPTNSGNGALDSGSGAAISGGSIIAVGSSGMAESFGTSSTQASILYNMSETHSAGETITLKDSSGNVLMTYKAEKTFNSVVISTPEIKENGTYTLTVGSRSYTIEMTSVSYSNGGSVGGMQGGMGGGMRGQMGGQADGEQGGMPGGNMGGMRGGMGGFGRDSAASPEI